MRRQPIDKNEKRKGKRKRTYRKGKESQNKEMAAQYED